MKENIHHDAHALNSLMFAPSVTVFSQLNDKIESDFLRFFLHIHFIMTSHNRLKLNDNDFATKFLLLSSFKFLG